MTIREALKGLTGYPIPVATLDYILTASDIDGADEFSVAISQSAEYKRAEGYVFRYLSEAPNVSQGGVSYSFTADDRTRFANRAKSLLIAAGVEDESETGVNFGFQGETL